MFDRRHIARGVAVLVLALLTVLVVSANRGALPDWILAIYGWPYGDQLGHFVLAGCLAGALQLALPDGEGPLRLGTLVAVVLLTAEELSQVWMQARVFDLFDLGAGLLGVVCASLLTRGRTPEARAAKLGP